jgi:polyisoprenoid-binding protein YceI
MKNYLIAFLFFLTSSTIALAGTYGFTKSNNTVNWKAVSNPGFFRINGEGGAAEGTLTATAGKVSGTVSVALDAYKTGSDLRDEHMKTKFLVTSTNPKATLELKDQPFTEGADGKMTGYLTLKGVTKPVAIDFKVAGKSVSAKFKVNLKDYPLGVPSWLGATMADVVDVTVDATTN